MPRFVEPFECDLEDIGTAIAYHDDGEYDSPEHWAEEFISSCHDRPKMIDNLANYFDYLAYARDAKLGGDVTFVELRHHPIWVLNN